MIGMAHFLSDMPFVTVKWNMTQNIIIFCDESFGGASATGFA